jgi:hypothetical protein
MSCTSTPTHGTPPCSESFFRVVSKFYRQGLVVLRARHVLERGSKRRQRQRPLLNAPVTGFTVMSENEEEGFAVSLNHNLTRPQDKRRKHGQGAHNPKSLALNGAPFPLRSIKTMRINFHNAKRAIRTMLHDVEPFLPHITPLFIQVLLS